MNKKIRLLSILFLSLPVVACNEETHVHSFGNLIPEIEATCSSEGVKSHYHCSTCGKDFDEGKNEITDLFIPSLEHRYILTGDETHYRCKNCDELMNSGKETIEYRSKTKLFIGSSITNGYNAITKNHYSFADMMEHDALYVHFVYDMEIYDRYFEKVKSYEQNDDGFAGEYQSDEFTLKITGLGMGELNGETFLYVIDNNRLILDIKNDKLLDLSAVYVKGSNVLKYASDGFSLSDYQPRWADPSTEVTDRHSYVGLFDKAVMEHGNEIVDSIVIQLSTNDVGLYTSSSCTTHLPFGEVTDNSVTNSKDFDQTTSLGALEYIVSKAKEVWNCDVTIFACHMDSASYSIWKSNSYDLSKVVVPYSELYTGCQQIVSKYGTNFIDFWSNKDVNDKLHSNASKYLSDSLHLQEKGYQITYYNYFMDLFLDTNSVGSNQTFEYKFYVDDEVYKTINITNKTKSLTLPIIPLKKGYSIKGWDIKFIEYKNLRINAVYEKD